MVRRQPNKRGKSCIEERCKFQLLLLPVLLITQNGCLYRTKRANEHHLFHCSTHKDVRFVRQCSWQRCKCSRELLRDALLSGKITHYDLALPNNRSKMAIKIRCCISKKAVQWFNCIQRSYFLFPFCLS